MSNSKRSLLPLSWPYWLLGLGLVVRLVPYLYNRALWLDEANLANGIIESSFLALTQPLPYNQAAPIGFLWLEKAAILFLGPSEYALRLWPLLFSGIALWLFYQLAQYWLSPPFSWWALAFFVFSPPLVYYASEVKQYGLDLTCAIWIGLCATRLLLSDDARRQWVIYAGSGALLLWCAQPLVFVLAGSWLALANRFREKAFRPLASTAVLWALSFGGYYFGFLQSSIGNAHLQDYHQQYFMPLAFGEWSTWTWLGQTFLNVLRNPVGIFFNELALPLVLLGVIWAGRKDQNHLLLFLLPFLLAVLISGFHLYSTIPRLLLFAVPGLILFLAKGLAILQQILINARSWPWLRYPVMLLAAILLLQGFLNTAIHNMRGIEVEEIKPVLQTIEHQHQPQDWLYIYELAQPAFRYYQNRYDLQDLQLLSNTPSYENWQQDFSDLPQGARIWLLFSHYKTFEGQRADQYYRSFLDQHGQLLWEHQTKGSTCYLYQWETITQ